MSASYECFFVLLVAEKELNELLQEVFDGYESDASETLAAADGGVQPDDVQLSSAGDVDTPTSTASRDLTLRKWRSTGRGKDDADDDGGNAKAACSSHEDVEKDTFHYPGHIPPLKYIYVLLTIQRHLIKHISCLLLLYNCNLRL